MFKRTLILIKSVWRKHINHTVKEDSCKVMPKCSIYRSDGCRANVVKSYSCIWHLENDTRNPMKIQRTEFLGISYEKVVSFASSNVIYRND